MSPPCPGSPRGSGLQALWPAPLPLSRGGGEPGGEGLALSGSTRNPLIQRFSFRGGAVPHFFCISFFIYTFLYFIIFIRLRVRFPGGPR